MKDVLSPRDVISLGPPCTKSGSLAVSSTNLGSLNLISYTKGATALTSLIPTSMELASLTNLQYRHSSQYRYMAQRAL